MKGKRLSFLFIFSESGLFNELREIQIKKSCSLGVARERFQNSLGATMTTSEVQSGQQKYLA
jgi:hypothetical protein